MVVLLSFGEELHKLRTSNNITVKEMCDAIGYGDATYSLIESGKRTFDDEEIREYFYFKVQRAVHFICNSEDYNYKNITEDNISLCQDMLEKGGNVVQVAVDMGVDEVLLKKELKKRKIKFADFNY